jgi:hypothetical protein
MKLEEALKLSSPNQCLARDAWKQSGSLMHLVSSAKTLEEIKLSLDLSPQSLEADDWNIYEIMK